MPKASGARDWTRFLRDMQRFSAKGMRCKGDLDQQQFLADEMILDAVLRNLELLGEAAKEFPSDVRLRHPTVPWRRIAGLRDVLAHAYFGVEDDTIGQTVSSSAGYGLLKTWSP